MAVSLYGIYHSVAFWLVKEWSVFCSGIRVEISRYLSRSLSILVNSILVNYCMCSFVQDQPCQHPTCQQNTQSIYLHDILTFFPCQQQQTKMPLWSTLGTQAMAIQAKAKAPFVIIFILQSYRSKIQSLNPSQRVKGAMLSSPNYKLVTEVLSNSTLILIQTLEFEFIGCQGIHQPSCSCIVDVIADCYAPHRQTL